MRVWIGERSFICDVAVTVPYSGIEEDGEVTFYLKSDGPYRPATFDSPAEGGGWETVEIVGNVMDDDIPDLEEKAHAKASEDEYWGRL